MNQLAKLKKRINNLSRKVKDYFIIRQDIKFLKFDKSRILRTTNLEYIPNIQNRVGGKYSYGEWCHVIGIFQTLLGVHLPHYGPTVLDIGCGTGIMLNASFPFVNHMGHYIGLDTDKSCIDFCQNYYPRIFGFIHHDVENKTYNPDSKTKRKEWFNISDNSIDCVTALSLWTHLEPEDAKFYMKEVDRVLNDEGVAIITVFLLDEDHVEMKENQKKDGFVWYHRDRDKDWLFDVLIENGNNQWFTTKWTNNHTDAIGITYDGFLSMLERTNLYIDSIYPGNWENQPGVFFQDIVVLRKINCDDSEGE